MEQTTTEMMIGKTLFIVTAECSTNATETIEKKLERLIYRHVSDTKSYQTKREKQLDLCSNKRENGMDII